MGLREYGPQPDVIERCGRLIYHLVDSQTKELVRNIDTSVLKYIHDSNLQLDFWIYNAFSDEILKKLIDHHQRLQSVKAVTRGQQFHNFSEGAMYPVGTRSPMGGSAGSAYALYAGMGANTLEGLEALFDHAEVIDTRGFF